ncbi:DEAD/DEAH box helicase family protein [Candidatus Nitrososphaera evergladensis]|uniref:type I restriction endonuclease subunit R n=1 Tax=Candidatus Nitrososphaera evergladensis TaxID=1459637 RepID=UPI0011E5C331|nr:DEAD/DEAH box helicase family protein [Candidatus Nitrososphaera evergladensis]
MTTDSEFLTRREKIDVLLKEAGWDVKNVSQAILEVDTLQSDFKSQLYRTVSDTLKNEKDSKYADYLLLDGSGDPLAVIEAKKTSKDPILGEKQAELYAQDIKNQTGKDIFIYFTNGYEIWFWNKPHDNPRMVKGFHGRDALERLRFQNISKKDFEEIPINREITDRPYQIESIKRVLEGIGRGRRKFLIVQATGTGKTRVAMSLIDILLRSNRAQKILFLADRKALRDQAYEEGFKIFFPSESKTKVFSGDVDLKNHRLYASTIQTFMECYRDFSIGDFDVIISDEAHRSIYNKWKDVFTYFDCIQIGLTATPAQLIDRDTFRFFDCLDGKPTALYTYEQAVHDGYLVDFKVHEAQTHFQIEGIKSKDIPEEVKKKLLAEGKDEEDLDFEGTEIEKRVIVTGTNEAIICEYYEYSLKDKSGTLPAKTIIFAISKKHAKRLWESIERLYPEHRGRLANVIVSEDSRAQETLRQFKRENYPRIAISVDMLDTGVDIPEVCNLVFAKPVFSNIKFWQMIGRGTRSNEACKNHDWLPDGKKTEFLIFDFWKNFEFFDMHPEGKISTSSEALPTKIFLVRLQQYQYFKRNGDLQNAEAVLAKLIKSVDELPKDSANIRERLRDVEIVTQGKLFDNIAIEDEVVFLKEKIAPLMRYASDININRETFRLKTEQLGLAILTKNNEEFERAKETIGDYLMRLPRTIKEVERKEIIIDQILSKNYWKFIEYKDAMAMQEQLVEIMDNVRPEPVPKIVLDIDDLIQERKKILYGFPAKEEYIDVYKEKVEAHIKRLAFDNEVVKKLQTNQQLTEEDLHDLEDKLNSPDLFITEELLRKVYSQKRATIVDFVKHILGLYRFASPQDKISEAFKTYMIERNYLNANQVNFLRTLQTVFTKKKHIELDDLFESPFTNFGADAPIPLFSQEELHELVQLCNKLEN